MQIDKSSLKIIDKNSIPSIFHVRIVDNTLLIDENSDGKIYGNLLVIGDDIDYAFNFAVEHKDAVDSMFFLNVSDGSITTIAKPLKQLPSIKEVFNKIADITNGFEKRKEQIILSQKIKDCLTKKLMGIFEAPTGTGKSLAYLVPSILYAKKNSKKVVISTNTINLQKQLIEKDLPVLKNITDFSVKLALGRENYLCKRKLDSLLNKGDIFLFNNDTNIAIKKFAETSKTGLKSEFFSAKNRIDKKIWDSISSTSLSCAHTKCPYYKNRCFYYQARQSLESADLIIANHHIVLSDALIKEANVLPDHNAIIFDEAHNLEKNATNYFTKTVSTSEIRHLLERLYTKKKSRSSGLILNIDNETVRERFINSVEYAKETLKKEPDALKSKTLELTVDGSNMEPIRPYIEDLKDSLNSVCLSFKKTGKNETDIDIAALTERLNENLCLLDTFLNGSETDSVKWIKKTQSYIHFNITPMDISQYLQTNIYDNVESVIFTSATLSVNGKFDFFKKNTGIGAAEEFIAKNSFDYENISRLIIMGDAPTPNSQVYVQYLSKAVLSLAEELKNNDIGILVLFTSYRMLNGVYESIFDKIKHLGLNILRQGEFDNFQILKMFKKNKGFLFATSSFWEGVDVKGDALSVVFITRLPFEVPNTPIEQSRYKIMEQQRINSFFEYSLPKAVLKFKQGFGRLIRSKEDKGIIVVSDSRITNRSYGKIFVDSLPKIKKEVIKINEIKNSVRNFFNNY